MSTTDNVRLALPVGTTVNSFHISSVLGQGGFGITYRAQHERLKREVALKELLPVDIAMRRQDQTIGPLSSEYEQHFEDAVKSFLEEAQILAQFNHDNIIDVFDCFEANGTAYMATTFKEGQDLATWLKKRDSLPDEQTALDIILPVLSGLQEVHEGGLLHRDIKPANLYICDSGQILLLDFGAARQSISSKSRPITSIVTPGYAPFEQYYEDGNQGPWSDIYAMGATIHRFITGKKPPDAPGRERKDTYVPVSESCSGRYSKSFLAAVDRSLRIKESARPQSVAEWLEMFQYPEPGASSSSGSDALVDELLTLKGNDYEGNEYRLRFKLSDLFASKRGMVIGRSASQSDLILDNGSVSRAHAVFRFDELSGEIVVEDFDSGNGTWVDGRKTTGPTLINDESKIELGEVVLSLTRRRLEDSKTISLSSEPIVAAASSHSDDAPSGETRLAEKRDKQPAPDGDDGDTTPPTRKGSSPPPLPQKDSSAPPAMGPNRVSLAEKFLIRKESRPRTALFTAAMIFASISALVMTITIIATVTDNSSPEELFLTGAVIAWIAALAGVVSGILERRLMSILLNLGIMVPLLHLPLVVWMAVAYRKSPKAGTARLSSTETSPDEAVEEDQKSEDIKPRTKLQRVGLIFASISALVMTLTIIIWGVDGFRNENFFFTGAVIAWMVALSGVVSGILDRRRSLILLNLGVMVPLLQVPLLVWMIVDYRKSPKAGTTRTPSTETSSAEPVEENQKGKNIRPRTKLQKAGLLLGSFSALFMTIGVIFLIPYYIGAFMSWALLAWVFALICVIFSIFDRRRSSILLSFGIMIPILHLPLFVWMAIDYFMSPKAEATPQS